METGGHKTNYEFQNSQIVPKQKGDMATFMDCDGMNDHNRPQM